jgi:phosphoglycolate phosphatase
LDLDGPLLDGKQRHYSCYRNILEASGFEPIGIDEYWETKRGLVNRRELLKMSGAEAIYERFLAEWLLLIESPDALVLDRVQAGAIECLRNWKQERIEMILVTMRKNKNGLKQQLHSTGLGHHLDNVLVSDHAEGGEGKADAVRQFYSDGLDRQFFEEGVWIGDTEADWQAAKSLGCEVFLVSNGLRNEKYLRSLEGAVVEPSIASFQDVITGK